MGSIMSVRPKVEPENKVSNLGEIAPLCSFCKKSQSVQIAVSFTGMRIPCCDDCLSRKAKWLKRIEKIDYSTRSNDRIFRPSAADPEYKKKRLDNARKRAKRAVKAQKEQIQKFRKKLEKAGTEIEIIICALCGKLAQWVVEGEKVGQTTYCCEKDVQFFQKKKLPWVKSIKKLG